MREYGDEDFICMLREAQEDVRNTQMKAGIVFAGDKQLLFQEREIFRNLMWMWMPEDFTILGKKYAEMKYPSGRPDLIYSNPDTTVNVSFLYRQEKLAAGQEVEVRDDLGQIVQNLYPTCGVLDKNSVPVGESEAAWVDFLAPAMDSYIYNMMFVVSLKGRLLMGTCNCPEADQEDWKDLFVQMIATIRTV